jgi:hypothetical protein
MAMGMA